MSAPASTSPDPAPAPRPVGTALAPVPPLVPLVVRWACCHCGAGGLGSDGQRCLHCDGTGHHT